jgi:hypothetical protein
LSAYARQQDLSGPLLANGKKYWPLQLRVSSGSPDTGDASRDGGAPRGLGIPLWLATSVFAGGWLNRAEESISSAQRR